MSKKQRKTTTTKIVHFHIWDCPAWSEVNWPHSLILSAVEFFLSGCLA